MGVPRYFYSLVLIVSAGTIACGGGNNNAVGFGGNGGGQAGSPVYVTNSTSSSVSVYQLDQISGALQRTPGSPASTSGSAPDSMATDPAKKFLLVANSASASISVFNVNSATAALTNVSGSPFSTPPNAIRMVMHPRGNFVYTLSGTPGQIQGYSFDSITGALIQLSGFPVSLGTTGETGLAISPNGGLLYTSNSGANRITGFAIGPDGGLTGIGTIVPIQGSPLNLTFETSGNFLFGINSGGNSATGSVSVFSVSPPGILSEVPGSPFPSGTTPVSAVFSHGSLYVVNQTSNTVSAFALNGTTGQLTELPGSPFRVGASPVSVATAVSGRFLIVTSSASSNTGSIFVFAIAADGTLTQVLGSPFTPDTATPDQVLAF